MDPVSSLTAGAPGASSAFSSLSSEEFVRIIFTELSKQDPLAPNDSKALLEQLSTLRSIQSDIDLSSKLGSLVSQSELAAASGMIGRTISGVSINNTRVEGVVESVVRTQDGSFLKLAGDQYVHMSNVDEILAPAPTGGSGQ